MRPEAYRRQKRVGHPRTQGRDCYGLYKRVYPPMPHESEWDDDPYFDGWCYDEWWDDGPCVECGRYSCDGRDPFCFEIREVTSKAGPLKVTVFEAALCNEDKFECSYCGLNTLFSKDKVSRKARAFHEAGHCAVLWAVLRGSV
jgi:hypothetical protein